MILLLELGLVFFHLLAWVAVGHALLTKRDPRSALGWSVVVLFMPVVGVIAYAIFGIGRTESRAAAIMRHNAALAPGYTHPALGAKVPEQIPEQIRHMELLGRHLTQQHLCGGNSIEPLVNGNEAYPAMLEAIRRAKDHVYLLTYIFNSGEVADSFAEELTAAVQRGVDVRILLDGLGRFYSFRTPVRRIAKAGARVAYFLPPRLFPPNLMINLRDHRKLLVCDDVAFTGGMNIADYHVVLPGRRHCVQDMQFCCQGPITRELRRAFLMDWGFATGKYDTALPERSPERVGRSLCRIVMDGPGGSTDPLNDLIAGSISNALKKVRIMTPYFLPSREIYSSLRTAAEKGVDVKVILPAKNNLFYVHWATFRLLRPLLQAGVGVFYQKPPFAHTKLLAIDDYYCQIGSANYDARSLRLNFELNTEIFDTAFNGVISSFMEEKLRDSREITTDILDSFSLFKKLRNAAFWLFSPYL